jgi:hypothetical protein
MPKDLEIRLADQPGTVAGVLEATGNAGINVIGGCGFVSGGVGTFHICVEDAGLARQALEAAAVEVSAERDVVVAPVENRPGGGARVFRKIADAGINIDLAYTTADGRLVIGGGDAAAIERALG